MNASVELDIDELYNSICCEAKDAYYDKEKKEVVESVTGIDFDKAEAQKLWDAAELGETVEIPVLHGIDGVGVIVHGDGPAVGEGLIQSSQHGAGPDDLLAGQVVDQVTELVGGRHGNDFIIYFIIVTIYL